jgi:hypothetical protein
MVERLAFWGESVGGGLHGKDYVVEGHMLNEQVTDNRDKKVYGGASVEGHGAEGSQVKGVHGSMEHGHIVQGPMAPTVYGRTIYWMVGGSTHARHTPV